MVNPNALQGMEFVNKFIPMYEGCINLGMTKRQAIRALSTQEWFRDFVDTPEWLTGATKLPKGYKWSDGTKFHLKGGKRKSSETYYFLIIDDDLYIKNYFAYKQYIVNETLSNAQYFTPDDYGYKLFSASPEDKRQIIIIKNWKGLNANEVNYKIGIKRSVFFSNSIIKFWHDNECDCGFTQKISKDVKTD